MECPRIGKLHKLSLRSAGAEREEKNKQKRHKYGRRYSHLWNGFPFFHKTRLKCVKENPLQIIMEIGEQLAWIGALRTSGSCRQRGAEAYLGQPPHKLRPTRVAVV